MDWAEIIKKLVPVIIDIIAPMLKGNDEKIADAIIDTETKRSFSSFEKLDYAIDRSNVKTENENDLEKVISLTVDTANQLTRQ